MKELDNFTDSFFWNTRSWYILLNNLLSYDPAGVGITFFFGENIRMPVLNEAQQVVFENPRIVWGADLDSDGRPLVPSFASLYNNNIGIKTLNADGDGVVRRFASPLAQIPHMSLRLAQLAKADSSVTQSGFYRSPHLINYIGPRETFETIDFRDVIEMRVSPEKLRDKIVIIGSGGNASFDQVRTPVGAPDHPAKAPRLGEHGRQVLAEYGFTDGEITGLLG
jgi:CHASE2 domain-containing sensor protein